MYNGDHIAKRPIFTLTKNCKLEKQYYKEFVFYNNVNI